MNSRFTPIALDDYIAKHLRANPEVSRADLKARLEFAIAAHRAGKRCSCGAEIWIIGSAEVGLACFTCITGEARPDGDYEIAIDRFAAKSFVPRGRARNAAHGS